MLAAASRVKLDQLASQAKLADPASKEFQVPPEFPADPHRLAKRSQSLPANPAHLDLPDPPDTPAQLATKDLPDLPATQEKTAKMVSPAQSDLLVPQEPPDPMDLLVTRAKTDPRSQSFQESLDRPETMAPLARKDLLVPPDPMEPQASLVIKDPSELLDPLAKMESPARKELLDPLALPARRVSAPSTALWMVVFSSKTAPDCRRPNDCGSTSQIAFQCGYDSDIASWTAAATTVLANNMSSLFAFAFLLSDFLNVHGPPALIHTTEIPKFMWSLMQTCR